MYGQFRDGFPRIFLDLPLASGGTPSVDFIVDSGFEGDLTVSPDLLPRLDAVYAGEYPFALADLTYRTRSIYRLVVNWQGEERVTEDIAMEGNPLLRIGMLRGSSVYMEIADGGDVTVEAL
jgi:predicted aspartyl protease